MSVVRRATAPRPCACGRRRTGPASGCVEQTLSHIGDDALARAGDEIVAAAVASPRNRALAPSSRNQMFRLAPPASNPCRWHRAPGRSGLARRQWTAAARTPPSGHDPCGAWRRGIRSRQGADVGVRLARLAPASDICSARRAPRAGPPLQRRHARCPVGGRGGGGGLIGHFARLLPRNAPRCKRCPSFPPAFWRVSHFTRTDGRQHRRGRNGRRP